MNVVQKYSAGEKYQLKLLMTIKEYKNKIPGTLYDSAFCFSFFF